MSRKYILEKNLKNPNIDMDTILENIKVHELNQGRTTYGEYHHLMPILRKYDDKFKQYTRMKVETFDYILSKIEDDLTKDWCNLHNQPILPEEQLVVTLRFLATGMKYSDLSFTFRMGKSTICEFVRLTLDALWTNLWPIHMPVPTTEQLLKISEDFHSLRNLPHCVGAIDVRHIEIKKPSHSGSLYYNYKGFHSITFQAVVDARYKYISIDVGGYGKQHDSATLKASSFYEALEENIIILPKAKELPGSKTVVPYFFIGDGAYPLMQNLIKPFPGEELSDDQIKYNKRISGPRMVVECTFGQDCQRWHIYYTKIECEPETVERIARAISVMHNVIIDMEKGDKNEDNNKNPNLGFKKRNVTKESRPLLKIARPDVNTALVQEGFPVGNGREVREKLMAYFKIQSNGKRSKKQCKKIKLK